MSPLPSLPSRLRAVILGATVAVFLLGGCASNGNPRDPFEPLNRGIYKFNDAADKLVFKPVAEVYRDVIPQVVRTGISNFFSNINDVIVALNNLLQGKIPAAMNDVGRILINTTLGVLGFMDPATELGVEKNNEDFGQTLGFWGLGDGPYIVLPFLGPSSLRDTVGWAGDIYSWPITYLDPDSHRNVLIAIRFEDVRAGLLEASKILETAALDPYEFVRDAYLQRRRNLVYDGNPPDDSGDDPKEKPSTPGPQTRSLPATAGAGGYTALADGNGPPSITGAPDELENAARATVPARQPEPGTDPTTPEQTEDVRETSNE